MDRSAETWVAFDMTFTPDSGHGGRTRDQDGDEIDGWDEGEQFCFESHLFN